MRLNLESGHFSLARAVGQQEVPLGRKGETASGRQGRSEVMGSRVFGEVAFPGTSLSRVSRSRTGRSERGGRP